MKPIVQNMHKALLIIVIALLGSTSLFALTPPVNIGHTVKSQNPLKVELWFIIDDRDQDAVEFAIYQASGQTEDMSLFSKIGSVQRDGNEKYYYTVENLAPGSYTFFVKSVDQAGVESERSKITVVKQNNEEQTKIKIEGNIPESLCRGKDLRIEFKASLKNTEASQFIYELLEAPDGMTISQNGVLEWNGSANINATSISFAVRVSVDGNPNATSVKQITIKLKNCDETPKDDLYFNEPLRKGCVGKEYRYEIGAKYKGARENTTIRYSVINAPDGFTIDENGVATFTPTEVREHRIVILIEVLGEGEVIIRKELVIEVVVKNCDENNEEKAGLRFVSTPRKEICLLNDRQENAVYRYESRALISKEAQGNVTYALLQGPDGMTISSNGVVEWPVSGAGEYEVVIEATTTLEDGTSLRTEQRFVLRVIDCNEERPKDLGCAVIEGNVWSNGNAIGGEGAIVSLFRTDVLDANGNELKNIERLYRAKVMNGRYEVKVPNGSYKLRIEGGGVIPEWFENVTEGAEATVVSVNCDETRQVNFDVERREEAAPMTVAGRVIDASTGAGISGVKVVLRANSSDHKNGTAVQRFFATTGNDGNYVLTVPSHQSYIAYVEAQGYMVQYFDGVSDATGATPINNENVGVINFALTPQAGMVQGVSGTIVDETGAGIVGKVVAYQVGDENGTKPNNDNRVAYSVETDNIGNYSFRAMLPGNYVFMAFPMDREFVPGYYNTNSSEHTVEWQNATVVAVGEVMPTVQYNILVGIRKGEKGLARMRGHVRAGKNAGIVTPSVNELQTVFGAVISVYDNKKEISAVGISNFDGTFEVNELSIGTFNFVAQKVGFYTESGSITVDAAGNITVDQDIELQPIVITSVQESEASLLSVYPNPAMNKSTVQFVGNGAPSTIAVYNTMGVQVMSLNAPTSLGTTTVMFSVTSLPTGMYTVKVSNGSFVQTTSMSVVR